MATTSRAPGLAGGAQHGGDLDRVVAVIVDDGDAAAFAGLGEPPLHAAEPGEGAADRRVVHVHLDRDGDGRQRVLHVVLPEHRQAERPHATRVRPAACGDDDLERGAELVHHQPFGADVGLRGKAVGDDAAVGQARDHLLHAGMVDAQDGEAIERHVGDELVVAGDHGLGRAPMVQVLGVHVGDDGDDGGQAQEAAVALIGLDHHPLAVAEPGVGPVGVDDAAVDHGRVHAGGFEHAGDEARGRGLAMGATDGDGPFEAHQLGQHLGTAHDGDQAGAGGDDLGVVAAHGGADDHDLGVGDVGGVVADRDRDAGVLQAAHVGAVADVAALHGVAQRVQHLGDARHADAADAHEVDGADAEWQRPHACSPSVVARAACSTRSARRCAASGMPRAARPCALTASRSGKGRRTASASAST